MSTPPIIQSPSNSTVPIQAQQVSSSTSAYPALTDPHYQESWEAFPYDTADCQRFLEVVFDASLTEESLAHFLNSAPTFGHLLTYLTLLKDQLSGGKYPSQISLIITVMQKRCFHRLFCRLELLQHSQFIDNSIASKVKAFVLNFNHLLGYCRDHFPNDKSYPYPYTIRTGTHAYEVVLHRTLLLMYESSKIMLMPPCLLETLERLLMSIDFSNRQLKFNDPEFYHGLDNHIITNYPHFTFMILENWLLYSDLDKVIQSPGGADKFAAVLLNAEQFLDDFEKIIEDIIDITLSEARLEKLLDLILKTPELKSAIRQIPKIAISFLEHFSLESKKENFEELNNDEREKVVENWVTLFEYLVNRQCFTKENLEDFALEGRSSFAILSKLGKSDPQHPQTAAFAKRLTPIATNLTRVLATKGRSWIVGNEAILRTAFSLLLDGGWIPQYEPFYIDPLNAALLKFFKKSIPCLGKNAISWMQDITYTISWCRDDLIDIEDQEAYCLLFKNIYAEKMVPMYSEPANIYRDVFRFPLILEHFFEAFPKSYSQLQYSLPLGLAIAEKVLCQKNLPIADPVWIQKCILFLNSSNRNNNPDAFTFRKLLSENLQLAQTLLQASCVLSSKGKVKFIYPDAAILLTNVFMMDNVPDQLRDSNAKLFAAILLDQSVLKLRPLIPIVGIKNADALLERIIHHPLAYEGLERYEWTITKAGERVLLMWKDNREGLRENVALFVKNFIPVALKNPRFQIRTWIGELFNDKEMASILKETLIDWMKNPSLLNEIKAGKKVDILSLMAMLDAVPSLTVEEQTLAYKFWKESDPNTTLPLMSNHCHLGIKIMTYIAKKPALFRNSHSAIDGFLQKFIPKFQSSLNFGPFGFLQQIIQVLSTDISNDLKETIQKYYPQGRLGNQ